MQIFLILQKKFDSSLKEKEELAKENQAISKQLEDSQQALTKQLEDSKQSLSRQSEDAKQGCHFSASV